MIVLALITLLSFIIKKFGRLEEVHSWLPKLYNYLVCGFLVKTGVSIGLGGRQLGVTLTDFWILGYTSKKIFLQRFLAYK